MYPPLLLLYLFFSFFLRFSSSTPNNRRTLHQPFFPLPSTPPSSSPPSPPTTPQPFFPSFPSPPPSTPSSIPSSSSIPSPQQPTFPANISSLTYPSSNSAPAHHSNTKLVPAIVLPILTLGVLALSIAFFFNHRKRNGSGSSKPVTDRSESHRLFPPGSALSDSEKPPPVSNSNAHSSEFLYLGTLVDSRTRHGEDADLQFGSPYRKLGSPELQPLPPLSRQCRYNADMAITSPSSSEEEFYSPGGSSAEKTNSSSRRTIPTITVRMEKCPSQSSTMSTPSYPSSNFPSPAASSPPILSSPNHSSRRSFKMSTTPPSKAAPPPPPPLPFFASLRPLTPSPPKRKPHSLSPSSSPVEKDSDMNSRNSNSSNSISETSNSRISDYTSTPPLRQAPPTPPPPPPPPPPVGFWESQVRKPEKNSRGVVPVSLKKAVEMRNVNTKEETESCEIEKSEETTPVKLKPLHWDKVRASSDRAMVWDQLRSSSFQLSYHHWFSFSNERCLFCNPTNHLHLHVLNFKK